MAPEDDLPLSDDEWRQMLRLMRRYAEAEMDQWDLIRLDGRSGPLLFKFTRAYVDQPGLEDYRDLTDNIDEPGTS